MEHDTKPEATLASIETGESKMARGKKSKSRKHPMSQSRGRRKISCLQCVAGVPIWRTAKRTKRWTLGKKFEGDEDG